MFSQKLLVPVLAVLGAVSAQNNNPCTQKTATINSQADATQLAGCGTITGNVLIGVDASGPISLDGPVNITGDLMCAKADALTQLSSNSIDMIGGMFNLSGLTFLSTIQFTNLTSVRNITWTALPALTKISFDKGISSAKSVVISNTYLEVISGFTMKTIGTLDINNNRRLHALTLPLNDISEGLNIAANGPKLDVEFPNLKWANGLTFRNISVISIPSLAAVNGSLVFDEGDYSGLGLANLTTVGSFDEKVGSLSFVGNPKVTNITFPSLRSVGGGVQLANNTQLQTVSFPALTEVGGAVDLTGNFTLPDIPTLKNVAGALNIQSTAQLDCTYFDGLKSDGTIQGKETCFGSQDDPTTIGDGGSSSTGSSGGSKTSKNAAISYTINHRSALSLSVVGGLLGLLV